MSTPTDLIKNRPAETATPVAMVLAGLLARLLGVDDPDTILYIAIAFSFVPAAVTWMVVTIRGKDNADGAN